MEKSRDLHDAVRRELALGTANRGRRIRLAAISVAGFLLLGICGGPLLAQAPYRQEILPGFSSFDFGERSSPEAADLDGDGDFDLVVGNQLGWLQYFENVGTAAAPEFLERRGGDDPFDGVDAGDLSKPSLADLDGDGDLDAVVGNQEGRLLYFANTGDTGAPAFVQVTGSADPFGAIAASIRSSPDLADLDGDGDLDLVVGTYAGNVPRYFANTGSSSAPSFVERTGSASPVAAIASGLHPHLADLDGDGDLDALLGNIAGSFLYFVNTGSPSAAAFVQRVAGNPFAGIDIGTYSEAALADLDGDGDLDAISGEAYGSLRILDNTGSASVPDFQLSGVPNPLANFDLGQATNPDLADLDGDGDLDLLTGVFVGTLRYFTNTASSGPPAFVEATGSDNPFAGFDAGLNSSPELADLDGDGDLDAAVGESLGTTLYFEKTGSSSSPSFVQRFGSDNPFEGISTFYSSNPILADLDADGDLDAAIGSSNSAIWYFRNVGSATAPDFAMPLGQNPFFGLQFGESGKPALGDLDGDGDLDLLNGNTMTYFENTGTASNAVYVPRTGAANPFDRIDFGINEIPDLADLDGDGDLDVLAGELGGRLVYLRSLAEHVFEDGFESGDTTAWSLAVPALR